MATLFILVFLFIILILIRCFSILIVNHEEAPMNKFIKFGLLFFGSFLETIWAGLISVGVGLVDLSSITNNIVILLDKHPYTFIFC